MDLNILNSIPKEQLAHIPAGFPPPGVVQDLAHPHSTGNAFYIVGSIVMLLMFVFSATRFYAKATIWHKLAADDYTTIVAVLGTLLFFIAGCFGVKDANFGTHTWDLNLAQVISKDTIVPGFFVSWVSNIPRGFAKASFLLMYLEIFRPFRWFRWLVYLGLVVTAAFHTAVLIIQVYYSAPAPGQPWTSVLVSTRFPKLFRTTVPLVAGGFVIDIYILIIPMLAIKRLALSRNKKLGLALIFATGSIACVASALNVYYSYQLKTHSLDFSYHLLPVVLTTIVELCVGISCSCMPACARLYRARRATSRINKTSSSETTLSPSSWSRQQLSNVRSTSSEKTLDGGIENELEYDKSWATESRGVRTVVQVGSCPPDVEQGHIYVKRNYHQQFVGSRG